MMVLMESERIDLKGLSGGSKQIWIKQNKKLVVDYYNTFGSEDTCQKFCLGQETLQKILDSYEDKVFDDRLERLALKCEIATDAGRHARHELNVMRKQFELFQESVADQLAKNFLIPLLKHTLRLPAELENYKDDSLDGLMSLQGDDCQKRDRG